MGFFTDAYDLFCISLVTKLIGRVYYTVDGSPNPGTLPPHVSAAVNGVAFVGTLSGQLFFGWLGDKVGRKSVYGITLLLMIICSVASGLSFGHSPAGVMATLCFFRFWLGFGIGGDYPFSTTITNITLLAQHIKQAAAEIQMDIFINNRLLQSSAFSLSTIAARGRAVFEGWRSVMVNGPT